MPKKMCIIIIAFLVHAFGWTQALDESEKRSLEQKIVGIWLTKATPRKGIEYSILDYKSCFCLKHRCENNTSYNKKSFTPFSSRFTFNEDNTFSIAHLITLAPKSPCRYTYNSGTWEISDKKTIKITSPLTVFYTATINGKPWTGNDVYDDVTRNADLSFDENGNIAQICIREKSTDKKCKEVKFSIYPACIIDNNRLIDVTNRLEPFEPLFERTLQNLLFSKSYWYTPVDIGSLLLSTKSSAIGLLNLYCDLSINDNKFILEAFDHDKSKKMLWSTGGEVNLWQDGTGAIRIAFKFTDEPKITDLLEVDGPFSKEELVHRINRIILSEKVCYFEPCTCSSHRISYLYDLFEEFPERINEIKRLNLPRFHQINSTLSTYDKNLQAEQKKYSECRTENQKLMQRLINQHNLVAAVKNKESSGLCIHLIPLIEEHNNILELTKIEPEALNYAIKEVLGKKESNDNPVVAKKKRKKKKKKKIIQETHVVEAPKIEEVPQISRPAIVAEAAITAATLAQNWTGELVLDKPTRKGLSRISINLYLAENGEGILQSSLVNNAGEKEIQSLAISWTYKNQGSLSQLHIKALNDAIIMFDQSFRLPEKLRIEPRSKINHLLLSGEYKSSEFSWELRPTIQEVDVAEIEQYHHLSKKEKTQKDPKRLETLMAFIAGNVERVRTFRNTDRPIIEDNKTPQPKKEIPDFKVIDDINTPEFFPYIGKWTGIIYIDRKNVSKPLFAVNFEIGEVNKFEIRDLLTKDILYSDTIGSGILDDNKQLFLGFRPKELTFSPELFSPNDLPNKFEIIAGVLVGNKNDFSIHALKTSQSDSSGLNINHLIGIWDDQYHHEQNVHLELFADFTGQMTIIGKDAATKINHFSWNIEKNNDETYIRFLDNKLAKISVANHTDLITYSIDFLDSPDSLSYLRLERCVSLREEESVNSIIASNDKPVIDRSEHLEIASFGVDLDYPDKKLIKRNGFDILYSKEKKVPLAVSYKLKRDYLQQKVNRLPREAFMTDPFLQPDECAENKDYYKSGWDRGHMAPSSHMLRNLGVQQESFYLSNIVPQNHHLNAGTWAYLEILGQYFAKIYKDIQIITGPIYMPGKSVLTIGDNKVAVPHAFYKIFLYKAGKDIHVLPFILPNEPLDEEENISKYLTSIAEIEKNTGLEFLFNLNSQALHSLKNSQPTMW